MKYFLFVLILSSFQLYANDTVLKCLGHEEKIYHQKKVAGARYQLNQKLISELVQLSKTIVFQKDTKELICKNRTSSSIKLLHVLIKDGAKSMYSAAPKLDVVQLSSDKKSIRELLNRSRYTFVRFINDLQTQVRKPNCIVNKIPQLRDFYYKSRYTIEDVGLKKLIKEIKDLDLIFKNFEDPNLLNGC